VDFIDPSGQPLIFPKLERFSVLTVCRPEGTEVIARFRQKSGKNFGEGGANHPSARGTGHETPDIAAEVAIDLLRPASIVRSKAATRKTAAVSAKLVASQVSSDASRFPHARFRAFGLIAQQYGPLVLRLRANAAFWAAREEMTFARPIHEPPKRLITRFPGWPMVRDQKTR